MEAFNLSPKELENNCYRILKFISQRAWNQSPKGMGYKLGDGRLVLKGKPRSVVKPNALS